MTPSHPHKEDGFHHEAVFYEGDDEFVLATMPFIREGLRAGEPVLALLTAAKIEALRGELGDEAEQVVFRDVGELPLNPAASIPFWQEFVDSEATRGRPARAVAEPCWEDRSEPELAECERHESLLNLAFGGGTTWRLLCPYDAKALSPEVLEAARRNHPWITSAGFRRPNDGFVPPGVAPSPFEDPLPEPEEGPREMFVTLDELVAARRLIEREAARAGLDETRASDLVLVGNELLTNSARHGGGCGTLRIWQEEDAIVCEVTDRGEITDQLAGRHLPRPGQVSGYGLWLVNRLCDLVQIRSGKGRTVIRARMKVPQRRGRARPATLQNALYGFTARLVSPT